MCSEPTFTSFRSIPIRLYSRGFHTVGGLILLTACLERVGNTDIRFAYLNDKSLNVALRYMGIPDGLLARLAKILLEYPSGTLGFNFPFLSD